MVRRVNTSTSSVRDNTADSVLTSTSEPGSDVSSEAQNTSGEAAQPAKKRKRGPNKTKPGTFTVRTEACLSQTEIRKLLTAHAATMLGTDVASKMTLQIHVDGEWRALIDDPYRTGALLDTAQSSSITLQFATVIEADE
jgi:hypothetical protein